MAENDSVEELTWFDTAEFGLGGVPVETEAPAFVPTFVPACFPDMAAMSRPYVVDAKTQRTLFPVPAPIPPVYLAESEPNPRRLQKPSPHAPLHHAAAPGPTLAWNPCPPNFREAFGVRAKRALGKGFALTSGLISTWVDDVGVQNGAQATATRRGTPGTCPSGNFKMICVPDAGVGDDPDNITIAANTNGAITNPDAVLYAIAIRAGQGGVSPSPSSFGIFFSMGVGNIFYFYFTPDGICHFDTFQDSALCVSPVRLDDGNWHYLVGTAFQVSGQGTAKFYVDDVLVDTQLGSSGIGPQCNLGANAVFLGDNLGNGSFPYQGDLAYPGIAIQNTSAFTDAEAHSAYVALRAYVEGCVRAYPTVHQDAIPNLRPTPMDSTFSVYNVQPAAPPPDTFAQHGQAVDDRRHLPIVYEPSIFYPPAPAAIAYAQSLFPDRIDVREPKLEAMPTNFPLVMGIQPPPPVFPDRIDAFTPAPPIFITYFPLQIGIQPPLPSFPDRIDAARPTIPTEQTSFPLQIGIQPTFPTYPDRIDPLRRFVPTEQTNFPLQIGIQPPTPVYPDRIFELLRSVPTEQTNFPLQIGPLPSAFFPDVPPAMAIIRLEHVTYFPLQIGIQPPPPIYPDYVLPIRLPDFAGENLAPIQFRYAYAQAFYPNEVPPIRITPADIANYPSSAPAPYFNVTPSYPTNVERQRMAPIEGLAMYTSQVRIFALEAVYPDTITRLSLPSQDNGVFAPFNVFTPMAVLADNVRRADVAMSDAATAYPFQPRVFAPYSSFPETVPLPKVPWTESVASYPSSVRIFTLQAQYPDFLVARPWQPMGDAINYPAQPSPYMFVNPLQAVYPDLIPIRVLPFVTTTAWVVYLPIAPVVQQLIICLNE